MPRFKKQQQTPSTPEKLALGALLSAAESEAGEWSEVAEATRKTYESKAKQLTLKEDGTGGWDMASACLKSQYSMKAAGQWIMRKKLRALLKRAKQVMKKGETGQEMAPAREAQFAVHMEGVEKLLTKLHAFQALPWGEVEDPARRLEKSHKKRPAKDDELARFFAAAENSQFKVPMLVCEFGGFRGQEFADGIRVEASKKGGVRVLRFYATGAKADGKAKGLDVRCVESTFPAEATIEVQRRWIDLAKLATAEKTFVVKVERTASMTVGQRMTNAAKMIARKAKVDVAVYSMRHRVSAQVKAANPGDAVAVALALGHQSIRTQAHYSRANRGGGGISPVQIIGVQVPGSQVPRGESQRLGPTLAMREKTKLKAAVAKVATASIPKRPRL